MNTGLDKLNELLIPILKLTEEDFKEALEDAQDQKNYTNPLRLGHQQFLNKAGHVNERVVCKLMELIDVMKEHLD